jgi:hypothetical protein
LVVPSTAVTPEGRSARKDCLGLKISPKPTMAAGGRWTLNWTAIRLGPGLLPVWH